MLLPSLSKVLGKHVNNQLTGFIYVYSILSGMQSGFRSGYGCVTVTLKVLNYVTIAFDFRQCCADIFIDLDKAFDIVDHSILVGLLTTSCVPGLPPVCLECVPFLCAWFAN